ncbi:winged helix-turn-helix domain-containing protein [Streptomyces sp. NPDC008141]|uniref:winged helix-turn-helix domain-containing protein n=1 Tax=Streptomyces sp. NPDC008141 TaxID=3364815 RepID=UPI0036F12A66
MSSTPLVLHMRLGHYEAETYMRLGVQMVEWTGRPAYQQVADELRGRIAADEFSESGKLPSLAELQEAYGVTVTVARAAIRQLQSDGLAVSHQGKGAFLTPNSLDTAKRANPASAVVELREEVVRLRAEVDELRERVADLEAN